MSIEPIDSPSGGPYRVRIAGSLYTSRTTHPATVGRRDPVLLAREIAGPASRRRHRRPIPREVHLQTAEEARHMLVPALMQQFESCARALAMNLEGVTDEEALRQPEPDGNCLHWIVGHILASRNRILELLGEEPVWAPEIAERYGRGTPPISCAEEAPATLAEMREVLDRSQERIIGGLERLGDRRLKEMIGKRSRAQQLAFMQFHEAYHVGQTGTLRRMVGKGGAIP